MYKVFIHSWLPEGMKKELNKRFDLTIHDANESILSPEEFNKKAKGANGVISQGNIINSDFITNNRDNLKIIANVAVGFDNIDIRSANLNKILVTNTPGVLNMAVADMALGLLLALVRRIVEGDKFVRDGKFIGNPFPLLWGTDLAGENLGIIGMGRIGREVAKRAKSFNLFVKYHNRNKLPKAEEEDIGAEYLPLDMLLKTSKFILLLCPLTNETYHLINNEQIKKMRKDAFIINIARGPIINEKALVSALIESRIAGAALDVFENEPKFDKRLSKMKNVIMTPHAGSATFGTRSGMVIMAASNILAYFSGGKVPNLVNGEFI